MKLGSVKTNPNAKKAQQLLGSNFDAAALDAAIADWIHGDGYSFGAADSKRFINILTVAGIPRNIYSPPNRKEIGGNLLDITVETYDRRSYTGLTKNARLWGLFAYGDGATISRSPLMNVLAGNPDRPCHVFEIADATNHIQNGGKKDAVYVAELFRDHMHKVHKDVGAAVFDIVYFDGASNVQNGGELLCAEFPGLVCLHGAEHVVSLHFKDIAKLPVVSWLINCHKLLYNAFGSGACHGAHNMFRGKSKHFNSGRFIGLDRGSDQRMASFFYALLRDCLLQNVLQTTVHNPEFIELKLRPNAQRAVKVVENHLFWERARLVVQNTFSALLTMRLADRNSPGMDKLLAYTLNCSAHYVEMEDELNSSPVLNPDPESLKLDFGVKTSKKKGSKSDEEHDAYAETAHDDKEYAEEDVDEEEDSSDDESGVQFGTHLKRSWQSRKMALIHIYSQSGFLLSVDPKVVAKRKSVSQDVIRDCRLALDKAVRKIYYHQTPAELDKTLNQFAKEYQHFADRTGKWFGEGREFIWSSEHVANGSSHLWHQLYSKPNTDVLGNVSCRVLSKLLGTGNAERNWGAMEEIKSGKRSHLGSEKAEKQCKVYFQARQEDKAALKPGDTCPATGQFQQDDFAQKLWFSPPDSSASIAKKKSLPPRFFQAYVEDWEPSLIMEKTDKNEQRFKLKY
jgi:hypothetical protein